MALRRDGKVCDITRTSHDDEPLTETFDAYGAFLKWED